MKSFDARFLLAQVRILETVVAANHGQLDQAMRLKARSVFSEVPQDCVTLGLHASRVSADKILKFLSKDDASFEGFRSLVREFQDRIIDEMSAPRFFIMSDQEADYYGNPRKGWEKIIARFPNSVVDIKEAHKYFACSRYAGTVFHILSVVEVGLIEFGTLIGVTDPLPGWTATTGKLKKILDTKYPARTAFERENSAFLEQMHAAIHAFQLAWRNKVSHAHGKLTLMTSDFHPEVAEEILITSRALLRRFATEAPVSPDPDA